MGSKYNMELLGKILRAMSSFFSLFPLIAGLKDQSVAKKEAAISSISDKVKDFKLNIGKPAKTVIGPLVWSILLMNLFNFATFFLVRMIDWNHFYATLVMGFVVLITTLVTQRPKEEELAKRLRLAADRVQKEH